MSFTYAFGKEGCVQLGGGEIDVVLRVEDWQLTFNKQVDDATGFPDNCVCDGDFDRVGGVHGWGAVVRGYLNASGSAVAVPGWLSSCATSKASGTFRYGGGSAGSSGWTGSSMVPANFRIQTGYEGGLTRVVFTFVGDGPFTAL